MIKNLTGIRGFLALWVVLFHGSAISTLPGPVLGFVTKGYLGVDAFFILSGYILTHVYNDLTKEQYPGYLVKRFSRIYPLHFICLLVFLVLGVFKQRLNPGLDQPWDETAQNFLMIHAWGTTTDHAWNWPSWSISAEWFAYLVLFPLITINRIKPPVKLMLSAAAWAGVIIYSESIGNAGMIGYTTLGIIRVIPEFLLGSYLYDVTFEKEIKGRAWINIGVSAFALAVIAFFPARMDYFIMPVLGWLVVNAEKGGVVTNALLGNRVSVYLGKISYSIYITQSLINTLIGYLTESAMVQQKLGLSAGTIAFITNPWVKTSMVVILCILLAVVMFHTIESPVRKWINRKALHLPFMQRLKAEAKD